MQLKSETNRRRKPTSMGLDDELRKAYKVKKRHQKGLHSLKKLCKTKQKSCLRNALRERLSFGIYASAAACRFLPSVSRIKRMAGFENK